MDRRQLKTRNAIFEAYISLISEKNYNKISIQEIIEKANIGRSTFYSHFQTRDELLDALCKDVFHHITEAATDVHHTHGHAQKEGKPNSIVCHMLYHIKENDHKILTLLSCEGNEYFLHVFKDNLENLMLVNYVSKEENPLFPKDFLLNHVSGSFVEMIQWWIKNGLKETPEQLDEWFSTVILKGIR